MPVGEIPRHLDAPPLATHEPHAADFNPAHDRPSLTLSLFLFAPSQCPLRPSFAAVASALPCLDLGIVRHDLGAEDGVGLFLAGREEGDVVAEAGRVDDHEVGARGDLLDPADAVRALRVAVELDLDAARAARQVARRAARELLGQVARGGVAGAFGLDLRRRGAVALVVIVVVAVRGREPRVSACIAAGAVVGVLEAVADLAELAEDVAGGGGVLDGREDGGAFAGRELVELLHVRVVAEGVAPPAADEVEAAAGHGAEEVVAAVGGAGELGGLLGGGAGLGGGVGGRGGHGRDGAEVEFVVEDQALVGVGLWSCVWRWRVGVGESLGELGGGFGVRIFGGGGGELGGG